MRRVSSSTRNTRRRVSTLIRTIFIRFGKPFSSERTTLPTQKRSHQMRDFINFPPQNRMPPNGMNDRIHFHCVNRSPLNRVLSVTDFASDEFSRDDRKQKFLEDIGRAASTHLRACVCVCVRASDTRDGKRASAYMHAVISRAHTGSTLFRSHTSLYTATHTHMGHINEK